MSGAKWEQDERQWLETKLERQAGAKSFQTAHALLRSLYFVPHVMARY